MPTRLDEAGENNFNTTSPPFLLSGSTGPKVSSRGEGDTCLSLQWGHFLSLAWSEHLETYLQVS